MGITIMDAKICKQPNSPFIFSACSFYCEDVLIDSCGMLNTQEPFADVASPEAEEATDWLMTGLLFLFPALGGLLFGKSLRFPLFHSTFLHLTSF